MLLVFAGAGASKAVNAQQYPTTVEFFNRLPDVVKNNAIFQHVAAFLQAGDTQAVIDIEQVLWALSEWSDFSALTNDEKGFVGWLMADNKLADLVGSQIHWPTISSVADNVAGRAETLTGMINKQVYEWYRRTPEPKEIEQTWLPLLSGLLVLDHSLEIVTTNYDLILEEVIDSHGIPVELGRTRGIQPRLDLSAWDLSRLDAVENDKGVLTKLHGSIDWTVGDNVIHVGTPTFRGNHADHVIIYPGFKGVPTYAPLDLMHLYFQSVVRRCTAAIFVGFAFRDEYINEILRTRLPESTQVVVINPVEIKKLPFQSANLRYIKAKFDKASSAECLAYLGDKLQGQSP